MLGLSIRTDDEIPALQLAKKTFRRSCLLQREFGCRVGEHVGNRKEDLNRFGQPRKISDAINL